MTRLLAFVVHNWPLKLAAVVLASLLYGVFVVTQNTEILDNQRIVVRQDGLPAGVVLLSPVGDVTQVRYYADDPTILVTASTFSARADLSTIDPAAPTNIVDIAVDASDPRVRVIDWQPRRVRIQIEAIEQRSVPVRVERLEDPDGFDIRDPEVTPDTAIVEGPASLVRRVDAVVARLQLDPSGIDFDRDVELIPVDVLGEQLTPVDVEPSSARIRIAVFEDGQEKSMPVRPNIIGTPAPGFELAGVSVDPLLVLVEGDADQLATLGRIDTEPISINGATEGFERVAVLALPAGILSTGQDEVRVTVTLRPVTGTRVFSVGVNLAGARSDRLYDLSVDRILVTVGGSVAALDQLEGGAFEVQVEVGALEPGVHQVPIVANLPAGLALVSASPPTVDVTVTVPATEPPSAAPSASASP